MTGAIFSEQLKRKNTIYTRLERHEYAAGVQTIQNKAFASSSTASLGHEIPLADVPEWADITPEVRIEVERPLFAYFRIPLPTAMTGTARWGQRLRPRRGYHPRCRRTVWPPVVGVRGRPACH